MRRFSLSRRVRLFVTLGLAAFWTAAVTLMSVALWSEQDEFFDQQLVQSAHVLLPLLSGIEAQGGTVPAPGIAAPQVSLDEAIIFRLFGRDGQILTQSALADQVSLPPPGDLAVDTVTVAPGYHIYVTPFDGAGHALQIAAPLAERREAFRETMTGFLLPMLALLPLTWFLVGWITRRALAPLSQLRAEIGARDSSNLDPIDAANWPEDLMGIVGTLNRFIARLAQSLDAERAFASNAAHELRTPVAIALAQAQTLRQQPGLGGQAASIDALERALQRMRRLVARLLQLARADAGIGGADTAQDLSRLTRITLDEAVPRHLLDRVQIALPQTPVFARIDPDAFAIVLGNLLENAVQHSPPDSPIHLSLTGEAAGNAVIEVANDGPAVPAAEQAQLTRRFARRHGEGFGLGLHICQQIVTSAGGQLQIVSPLPGQGKGFRVRVSLPGRHQGAG